ncbi:unnamed protein product [Citrullus colocynthis]|uniref:Uncharacterized protein n=1 Tax=Citrullus colocynthis TaxID=252529 RepID=A0ABP0Z3U9_9ROSI
MRAERARVTIPPIQISKSCVPFFPSSTRERPEPDLNVPFCLPPHTPRASALFIFEISGAIDILRRRWAHSGTTVQDFIGG